MAPRSAQPEVVRVTVAELPDPTGERWDAVLEILLEAGRRQPEVPAR